MSTCCTTSNLAISDSLHQSVGVACNTVRTRSGARTFRPQEAYTCGKYSICIYVGWWMNLYVLTVNSMVWQRWNDVFYHIVNYVLRIFKNSKTKTDRIWLFFILVFLHKGTFNLKTLTSTCIFQRVTEEGFESAICGSILSFKMGDSPNIGLPLISELYRSKVNHITKSQFLHEMVYLPL